MRASCCMSLRTATLTIGFLNTVVFLGMLGYWTLFLVRDEVELEHEKNSTSHNTLGSNLKITNGISSFPAAPIWICAVYIIYSVASVCLNVYLIFGASEENPKHLKMWLNFTAVVNTGVAIATIVQIVVFFISWPIMFASAWMVSLFVGIILYVYTFIVVRAFYKKLFEEDKQQIINNQRLIVSVTSEDSM